MLPHDSQVANCPILEVLHPGLGQSHDSKSCVILFYWLVERIPIMDDDHHFQ